jgi:UMF1 family MFS transporter
MRMKVWLFAPCNREPHNPYLWRTHLTETKLTSTERKTIWGWALYDWANSAFATTVMAVFFPIFFKQHWSLGVDVNVSTARLGLGSAAASLLVALAAPMLGAVADRSGRRKRLLVAFTFLGAAMSATLAFIPQGQWLTALLVYAAGFVGFWGAIVFYDSFLPLIVDERRLDRTSSLGYALGYLGGGLLFSLNVLMTLKPALFGLDNASQAVRLSFISVALWWGGFAIFAFAWLPSDTVHGGRTLAAQLTGGWRRLLATLGKIKQMKTAFTFLIAYWCYIDGVDTIIKMAVDFGLSLGFDFKHLIVALLITQFIGFPSALLFGRLGQAWGVRRGIYLALAIYAGVTLWGATMTKVTEFYVLAGLIGLVQGGIQALSRSYYARLIPTSQSSEFFGFYNMLGKFAAIIGPALMGLTGLVVKRLLLPAATTAEQMRDAGVLATRASIVSVLVLFILGAVLFAKVDEARGKAELAQLRQDRNFD